jgi:hypothetical protein
MEPTFLSEDVTELLKPNAQASAKRDTCRSTLGTLKHGEAMVRNLMERPHEGSVSRMGDSDANSI